MKKILLLATGGTIACKPTENGLSPMLSSDELLSYIPAARELCSIDTIQLMNIDSTNMHPDCWLQIAETIKDLYEQYDGFVIAHGTDTMAYTAAALSYLIQNSPKPIVLTGSQRPIGTDMTDAAINLYDSLRYACFDEGSGVVVVFGGKVIMGTRARKMNTKSYDAFSSINYPVVAMIHDRGIVQYIQPVPKDAIVSFYLNMDSHIFVLKLIPGVSADILKAAASFYDAFVLESYGVGGIPEGPKYDFHEAIEYLIQKDKTIVLTTQAIFEGSDISVYHSGHVAKKEFGVLEAYDMTLEATVTKLMWILGQTKNPKKIRAMFNQTIASDMLSQSF
ncbi:MAG: asparaginase [Firmicutes bacterium]|nr:asparaginase [Bacillota bacterium]